MKTRLIFLLTSALLLVASATAQTLSGVVRDKQTRLPVANADIYLKGTSYYTLTDTAGRFRLTVPGGLHTSLVVGHLTYETQAFDNLSAIPAEILMEERIEDLAELDVIGKARYSRKQKMAVFKRYFLGNRPSGRACRIVNEDDITLIYDAEQKELRATAAKPLRIESKYLGYDILFDLKVFVITYSRNEMADRWILQTLYSGYSVFKDVTSPDNTRIMRRREDAFAVSRANFFRRVIKGELGQTHWQLEKNGATLSPDSCFEVTDTLSMKKLRLLPAVKGHTVPYAKPVFGDIGIANTGHADFGFLKGTNVLSNAVHTLIAFTVPELLIDNYGNILSPWDGVIFFGEMNEQRLADTLPLDYEPVPSD